MSWNRMERKIKDISKIHVNNVLYFLLRLFHFKKINFRIFGSCRNSGMVVDEGQFMLNLSSSRLLSMRSNQGTKTRFIHETCRVVSRFNVRIKFVC